MSESLHTPKRERRKQHRPGEHVDAQKDAERHRLERKVEPRIGIGRRLAFRLSLGLGFVEKGFAATKSEEVAAKAGVSKGTLFLYFPSKE